MLKLKLACPVIIITVWWCFSNNAFGVFDEVKCGGEEEDGNAQFWAKLYQNGLIDGASTSAEADGPNNQQQQQMIKQFVCDISEQEQHQLYQSPPPTIHPTHQTYFLNKYADHHHHHREGTNNEGKKNKGNGFVRSLSKSRSLKQIFGTKKAQNNTIPISPHRFGGDPAKEQLLESLRQTLKTGKKKLFISGSNSRSLEANVKVRLAHSVLFLAKRRCIGRAEIVPFGGKSDNNDKRRIVGELIRLWAEERKGRRRGQRQRAKGKDEKCHFGDGKSRGGREKRVFRLLMAASAESADGRAAMQTTNSKGVRRKRRRRKREVLLSVFFILFCVGVLIIWMACNRRQVEANSDDSDENRRRWTNVENMRITNNQMNSEEVFKSVGKLCTDVFHELPEIEISEDGPECAVCLGQIEPGTIVKPLPFCEHKFHDECIEDWLKANNNACPLCRAKVVNIKDGIAVPNFAEKKRIKEEQADQQQKPEETKKSEEDKDL